jgi:flagellar hook-associated protein 3 FlgL
MRIASSTFFNQSQQSLARRQLDLARVQQDIGTGRTVDHLGEEPVVARNVLQHQSALRDLSSRRDNVSTGESMMKQADSVLGEVQNAVQTLYEMAVQFGNDTYSAQDRQTAAAQVAQLRDQLVDLANYQVNDRYLFGGLSNAAPPYDPAGVFGGDTGQLEIPVGDGKTVAATLPGGLPFEDPTGGPSLFAMIDTLETALLTNNGVTIRAQVGELETGRQRVSRGRQTAGQVEVQYEGIKSGLEMAEIATRSLLAEHWDTDMIEAVNRLRSAETGLRAATMMTARLEGLSLVNILGR